MTVISLKINITVKIKTAAKTANPNETFKCFQAIADNIFLPDSHRKSLHLVVKQNIGITGKRLNSRIIYKHVTGNINFLMYF